MADLLNRVGRSASSYLVGQEGGSDLGFIRSIVEVDGMQVQVSKLLGLSSLLAGLLSMCRREGAS